MASVFPACRFEPILIFAYLWMIVQYVILSQVRPFVKRKKENFEKCFFAPKHQPKGLAARNRNAAHKKRLVVFDVGGIRPRQRVILSEREA